MREMRKILSERDQKIGEQQETIKALLKSEKEKFESSTNHIGQKIPEYNRNGENPPLEAPKPKEIWTLKNVDFADSAILDMNPKFPSQEEAMNYIKKIAENPQAVDYKLANELYGKLVTKALKQGGTFEFQGNMCKYERCGNSVVKANRPKSFKKVEN